MIDTLKAALADGRVLRFGALSAFNVVLHQAILALAQFVFDFGPVASNIIAACLVSIPAFLIARHWVWSGENGSMFLQGFVFWVVALAGVVVSSLVVWAAQSITDTRLFFQIASLIGYTIVWAIKFFILDRLFSLPNPMAEPAQTHEINDCWNIDGSAGGGPTSQ